MFLIEGFSDMLGTGNPRSMWNKTSKNTQKEA